MAIRRYGQLSLGDSLTPKRGRSHDRLERLSKLIDWGRVEEKLSSIHDSRLGAPGYPPLMMIKALLLQQWYDLSDPALEDALGDRLSFRRFVGLALDERAPDHSTISRFRKVLGEDGLSERVFVEVTRQIDGKGLILRQGTMIDATLVEAHPKRPKKPKHEPVAEEQAASDADETGSAEEAPRAPSKLVASEIDPEASWAKKGHQRYFGYKGHVAVDHGSGIIRRCRLTTASVADTTEADAMILGDEKAVYADKAYDTKKRRARLKAQGIKDRIAHRPNKHHPLTLRQEQRNKGISKRRSGVERVFAVAKRVMGWSRVRYIGLRRNAVHFDLICTAINLQRLVASTT
jgi:transposase, IS5 family